MLVVIIGFAVVVVGGGGGGAVVGGRAGLRLGSGGVRLWFPCLGGGRYVSVEAIRIVVARVPFSQFRSFSVPSLEVVQRLGGLNLLGFDGHVIGAVIGTARLFSGLALDGVCVAHDRYLMCVVYLRELELDDCNELPLKGLLDG